MTPFRLYNLESGFLAAHFHEVQTVYHSHTQLRLYAAKPCQSLGAFPYQKNDLGISLLSA